MLKIRTNVLFGAEQEPPCVRRKSATAEAAERQYRATAEVAQRRRRYAPAAAALGWAGRDAAAALKCTSRKNHAIPPFVGGNVADVSISIKGRNSLPMRTRQRGENPAFAGRAGRSTGRGAESLRTAKRRSRRPTRANRGKSERSSGGGAGGGGEHSPPARAKLLTLRRGGQAPPAPQKPKVFHRLCRFFAAVPYFFRQ